MSFVFVFRTGPDIDHMSPLAWKLLDTGEEVHAVMSPGYDATGDHRIDLLRRYPAFHLHECPPQAGRIGRARSMLRATLPAALFRLARSRASLVAVEWGYGLPAGYERLRSPAGAYAVLRSLVGSFVRARSNTARQLRYSYVVAARLLGIPTVCLPHGLSIKLDMAANAEIQELLRSGPIKWQDRNRFAAFVFNTEHHRQWSLANASADPEVMQTWGSARWSPEWFEKSRELAPPFTWPEQSDRLKVVFMVPKWPNRVHAEEAIELFRRLAEMDEISLALMGHPRKKQGGSGPLREAEGVDWSRLHDISGANSVAVIDAADVVIDVGSSIGIEVVMQHKVLINPTYIHELKTLFDSVEGAAVVAHSADEVTDYLRRHAAGNPHSVPADSYEELLRIAVYGNRPQPYNVLEEYLERVSTLASSAH